MAGAPIAVLNDGIVGLFDYINADPLVDARVRLGIITFSDTARVLFPLTQLSDVTQIPVCHASGSASYAAAFQLLKSEIQTDVSKLRQNYIVHRPLVMFVSKGMPTDDGWKEERTRLISPDFEFRPSIAGFGVVGADREVIAEVTHWGNAPGKGFYFTSSGPIGLASVLRALLYPAFHAVVVDHQSGESQIKDSLYLGDEAVRVHVKDSHE
jgi:uncharacterized protein YegL